jgi:hypothetical protein
MRKTMILALMLMLAIPSASQAEHLISEDAKSTETIYFFSYHCGGCYALNQYITLYDEMSDDVNIRRVPVFSKGSEWTIGAKLHVLLNTLPETRAMTTIKKSKIGFLIVSMVSDELKTASDFYNAISASGVDVSIDNFRLAWSELDVYLEGAEYIINQASEEIEIKTPLVRVSKNGHVEWVSIDVDAENPGTDFVKKLNRVVAK